MRPEDMAAANQLLATPADVDLSVSQRLGLHVVARLAQRHGIEVSLTPTPGCGVTAAVVLPPSLFADPDATPDQVFADGPEEVPAGVVPALAASTRATPAADLPTGPPPAGRWIDLTDEPAAAPDGNGHGSGPGAQPDALPDGDGDASDWSGWWEPSPSDPRGGDRLSPIAARPPLAERVQPPSERLHPLSTGRPDPRLPTGSPDPHPRTAGPPIREGSRIPESAAPAVHSPHHNPTAPDAGTDAPVLSRRVPQAHLAPELRRNGQGAAAPRAGGAGPDAEEARAALSRYQASRQAAKAMVDDGDPGPGRPAGGGWA
jgi:hypothetical protein